MKADMDPKTARRYLSSGQGPQEMKPVGTNPSQSVINSYLATNFPDLVELYKQDVPATTSPSGSLSGNYSTSFLNSSTDPKDAVITHLGGAAVSNNPFLLVKDGNHQPAWYLFDLSAFSWNGTETLYLNDFWPKQGAISHVTLYGETTTRVPDASITVLLIGFGLTAMGFLAGRKGSKR